MVATERYAWIDIAKGVAIVLVVIGHALRGLNPPGIVPDGLLSALDSRIYAFHMPVFFAISGFFLTRALAAPPSVYIKGRVIRLLWPMLLWTYLFLLAKLAGGSSINAPVSFEDLLILPIPGHLHLWFLWALFVLHILLLLARPALSSRRFPVWMLVLLTIAALLAESLAGQMPNWLKDAAAHAPFLILGMWGGAIGLDREIAPGSRLLAIMVFAAVLAFYPDLPRPLSFPASLILTVTFLIAFTGLGRTGTSTTRSLAFLGQASMAIYLMHTMFSAGTRVMLLKLGHDGLTAHLVLGVAAGIVGPLVIRALAVRSRTDGFLGF